MSPEALQRARDRFALRFRRAVLARIELEREERVASRSPAVMNAERDALIQTLAAAGQSVGLIARATEAKGSRVRALLGLTVQDVRHQARVRERSRARAQAAR